MKTLKVLTIAQSLLVIISSIISINYSDNKIMMLIISLINIFISVMLYYGIKLLSIHNS
jgi:hypothetical protein